MKWIMFLILFFMCAAPKLTMAQIPIADVIKQGVAKVIKAIDLKVQRLQNKTIWLQNAQKVIENTMSKTHLDDITDWVQKQKDLYSNYYKGLSEVKSVVAYYHQVKDISEMQARIVAEYKRAWNTIKQDSHFTPDELSYISQVYTGILDQTVNNVNELLSVVNSFVTQMSDAKRIEIIHNVAAKVNENYNDLHQFNNQNALLSLQRTHSLEEAKVVKGLYGL